MSLRTKTRSPLCYTSLMQSSPPRHLRGRRLWLLLIVIPLIFIWKLVYPPAFLPHQRIVLGLPYRLSDPPTYMIPMGETIYHPKPKVPHGHPGIDFQWASGTSHDLIAAAAGTVTWMKQGASEPGKWDMDLSHGAYNIVYKELDDTAGLKVGSTVKRGDLVAHAGHYCMGTDPNGQPHCWFNVHWELASRSPLRDRFCPETYFDAASRQSIDAVWSSVPATDKVKSQFPDLCSGDYAGKAEKI